MLKLSFIQSVNVYLNFLAYPQSEVDYARYQGSRAQLGGLNFSEGVYRTGKLEESLTEGETSHPDAEGEPNVDSRFPKFLGQMLAVNEVS